jgi:hypothetical protein
MRLGRLQSQSGRCGEEKNSQNPPGIEPQSSSPWPVTVKTELTRLLERVLRAHWKGQNSGERKSNFGRPVMKNTASVDGIKWEANNITVSWISLADCSQRKQPLRLRPLGPGMSRTNEYCNWLVPVRWLHLWTAYFAVLTHKMRTSKRTIATERKERMKGKQCRLKHIHETYIWMLLAKQDLNTYIRNVYLLYLFCEQV